MANSASSMRRIVNATAFSAAGLRAAWANEASFRLECVAAVVLAPLALWLGSTAVERALLIGSCLLVLIIELVNSAIEAIVDRAGTGRHELAGRAKDLGSAAVFVSLILALAVWALVAYARFASG